MDCKEFVIKRFTAFGTPHSNISRSYANSASDQMDQMRAYSVELRTEIGYFSGVNIARARARVESDMERVRARFGLDDVLVTKSLQRSA